VQADRNIPTLTLLHLLLRSFYGSGIKTSPGGQLGWPGFCPGGACPPHADDGDAVYLSDLLRGGFRNHLTNPEFARKLKVAERLSRRYRHALKELAK